MTRRDSRKLAFTQIFQLPSNTIPLDELLENMQDTPEYTPDEFCVQLIQNTLGHLAEIDAAIVPHLKRWTLERLPRVSLAILRVSCAQLLYMPELPDSVVINEAVELAKEFGAEDEYSFVNGTLRSINEARVQPE